jgi:hypothetical protein
MKKRAVSIIGRLGIALLVLAGCATSESGDEGPVPLSALATPTTASSVTLTIANQSTEVICFVYVAPPGSDEWGESLLAGEAILPNAVGVFEMAPGTYDLRVSNCFDVPLAEELAVDVSQPLGWRITAGDS